MTETKDLLVEIGTEELPPKALQKLASAFASFIEDELLKANLSQQGIQWYATPRRIAVIVSDLETKQADIENIKRGPALASAFDKDGKPTPAATGFAKSFGVKVNKLDTQKTDKGEWLSYTVKVKGKEVKDLIPDITSQALLRLPIPRRMRWSDSNVEFVRPVHWVVVLFGKDVIPCTILGITASNITYGHRFHQPDPIKISEPNKYVEQLRNKGQVIADYDERYQQVRELVAAEADKLGHSAFIDPDLQNEVTALVEWPVAITGYFDKEFSELPPEVLVATLQDHQKYFPIENKDRKVVAFVTIANIESKSPEKIKQGNERVIRARLSDAAFFWQRDCSKPLVEYTKELDGVIFQKDLGTLADKTERIKKLSVFLASESGLNQETAERAAMLAKCDLLTEMVGEFPKLQGTMGRHYALKSNETNEVAIAIGDHYFPRFAGDRLPSTDDSRILAIADKLDTLVGIFAIGQVPTGEKDPYGLRRAALGVLRIMIECNLDIDLESCLKQAAENYAGLITNKNIIDDIFEFMMDRSRQYYMDKNIRPDVFDAVLACRPTSPYDFYRRIKAVTAFTRLPEAESLAAANKRIQNILRQAGYKFTPAIDGSVLNEDAELKLIEQLGKVAMKVHPLIAGKKYSEALNELSSLRDPVDSFFDNVMVMVEDETIRCARLQLLAEISSEFKQIADVSRLQG